MSQHQVAAKQPDITVTAGWDNPLQTFFAQVARTQNENDDDSDPVLLWLGATRQEHLTPDSLVEPLAPFAVLEPELLAQLRADRAQAAARRPSALQVGMLDLLDQARGRFDGNQPRVPAGEEVTPPPAQSGGTVMLLLKAAEQVEEHAAVLRERFSHTDMDSYATRLELSKEINQLGNFGAQMRAAASAPSHAVDLSRQEINYGPDPEAAYTDRSSGIEHVPYLQAAEREHKFGLALISPIVAQLRHAGIEVQTDFTIVSPPDLDLDMDDELEP